MATSVRNGGGSINDAPVVTDLQTVGEINQNDFTIEYKVIDPQLTIVRHYLYLNGENKSEITKEVGYEKENNTFTYKITGLEIGTAYTVQIKCTDGLDEGLSNAIHVTTKETTIYGFIIDENNSNPETGVTYVGDALGETPAKNSNWGSWGNKWPFNKIRVVGMKKGNIFKEIQKNNFRKYIDGTSVGADVDVMIEFPKIWWSSSKTGSKLTVYIADAKIDNSYVCYAHTRKGKEYNNLYIGAYKDHQTDGKALRSIFNKQVEQGQDPDRYTYSEYIASAKANYSEYGILYRHQLCLLQILFVLLFKSRDAKTALGKGQDLSKGTYLPTGTLDTKGLLANNSVSGDIKFLGLENLWLSGAVNEWVDGIFKKTWDVYISKGVSIRETDRFNPVGFELHHTIDSVNNPCVIKEMYSNPQELFMPKAIYDINVTNSQYYRDSVTYGSNSSGIYYSFGGGGIFEFKSTPCHNKSPRTWVLARLSFLK